MPFLFPKSISSSCLQTHSLTQSEKPTLYGPAGAPLSFLGSLKRPLHRHCPARLQPHGTALISLAHFH